MPLRTSHSTSRYLKAAHAPSAGANSHECYLFCECPQHRPSCSPQNNIFTDVNRKFVGELVMRSLSVGCCHSLSKRLHHGGPGRPPQRVHDEDTRPEGDKRHANQTRRCPLLVRWQSCAHSLSADAVFGGQRGGGVRAQGVVGQRPVLAAVVLQTKQPNILRFVQDDITSCARPQCTAVKITWQELWSSEKASSSPFTDR